MAPIAVGRTAVDDETHWDCSESSLLRVKSVGARGPNLVLGVLRCHPLDIIEIMPILDDAAAICEESVQRGTAS
jgi:hypothetical protein